MSMKNFNDNTSNRTCDLPVSSAVPQPTAALNCYCEGPKAFCGRAQLKAAITVTGWVRGQVLSGMYRA